MEFNEDLNKFIQDCEGDEIIIISRDNHNGLLVSSSKNEITFLYDAKTKANILNFFEDSTLFERISSDSNESIYKKHNIEQKTTYVYHICAFYNYPTGQYLYWDGIARLNNEISSIIEYRELKSTVSKLMKESDNDDINGENITITNLTLLKSFIGGTCQQPHPKG